jgi:hypothetical protein
MNLSKDQKQKLALGAIMLIGVVYLYLEFLLGPLQNARNAAASSKDALEPKIQQAQAQIAKTQKLKSREHEANLVVDQINSMIPEGSPIAWFPPRIAGFFKRQKIDQVSARMNNEAAEKELQGFRRLNWGVEAPRIEFIPFAAAVAELENQELLIEIQGFEVDAGRDDVGIQRAALTLTNMSRL